MGNDILLGLLAEAWVKWNKKEITGDALAMEINRLFPKETKGAWRKDLRKRLLAKP